jgi:hypothetical protein
MPALDPHKSRDHLVGSVQQIHNLYATLREKTTDEGCSLLAEQALVSLAVSFETFTSDLVVALICKDPELYLRDLSESMKKSLLTARYSHFQIQHLIIGSPKTPSVSNLRQLIMADGDNLAFPEAKQLRDFLTKTVRPKYVFMIDKEDEFFIDFIKVLRNACAHHSQSSMGVLNGRLKQARDDPKIKDTPICRALSQTANLSANNVGAYLKKRAPGQGQKPRLEFIASRISDIAFKWVP